MTWPTSTPASTANVDEGKDKITLARPDIKQNIDNVNAIIDTFAITTPSDGDILEYNSTTSKFENKTGPIVQQSTIVLNFDDTVATSVGNGEVSYDGDFSILGTNSTGIEITNPDSAGAGFIKFPAGTYTIRSDEVFSGTFGSTALIKECEFRFRNVSDDSLEFSGVTTVLSFYFRKYGIETVKTFSTETTIRVDFELTQGPSLPFSTHPPIIITRVA